MSRFGFELASSDDDFVVPDSPNGESPRRPAKRRRVQSSLGGTGGGGDVASETDQFSDFDDGFSDEQSLSEDHEREARSKSRSFVPKQSNIQENIFVTQLTQPDSSPERIRGPRWQKPTSKSIPAVMKPVISKNGPHQRNRQTEESNDDEEEALREALAASLDAFEEEQSMRQVMEQTVPRSDHHASTESLAPMDVSFELEDIPEDAFDSSPCLSPVSRPVPPPTFPSSFNRPVNRPQYMRQMTLYGMTAQSQQSAPQEKDWAPPDKEERPTHHKLNNEDLSTWWFPTNIGTIRDYQFNIAQKGLFHNLLVALPTGLGKTFIAATVMLNWYRWTRDAQMVFVAPTKPLVSQQVAACLEIAGIPRSDTTMLTGGAAPGLRAKEWQSKRVFFMTPQTLINDLKTGIADPKRIVLLVVDEAHRATGGYAYVEVVKFLRRFNQSFRVLALTATPGSTVESVQAVIDGLDISRVEIRTEHSLDIRDYVHSRDVEIETFENSDEMLFCMDLLSTTLRPLVSQLRTMNAYWGNDPMGLTAFGLTKARQQWMASDAGRNANFGLKGKVNAIFTVLASLAHAIDLLKYHGIVPFYRHILHFKSNTDGQKGGKWQKQVVQDESFKKLVSHLEPWTKNPEFIGHPKLEYLKSVILNHFMDAGEGKENIDGNTGRATRVMIFVHFRDSAEEVTRVLQRYAPMIRPHVFVGQSSAKGSEGMDQKTQLSIIEKFKGGTYNTIVATSIGEEGLDIGEVDLIVCYDSSASPIRMLQRMGRTGRKRAGKITLLLMKGKEEDNYTKAKDNYEKMQQMIASGSRFTFHDDRSARILPPGIRPVADKRRIEIPQENSQTELPEPKRKGKVPKRPPKKFHMPDDVETGFTRATTLEESFAKTSKKRLTPQKRPRTPTPEPVTIPPLEDVLLSDSQQQELEHLYQNIGDTSPQFIHHPRTDAFPRLQLVERPTKLVSHSSLTQRMIKTLQKMDQSGHDCEDRYKQIIAQESERVAKISRRSSVSAVSKLPRGSPSTEASRHADSLRAANIGFNHDDISALMSPEVSDAEPHFLQLPSNDAERGFDEDDSDSSLPDASTLFGSRSKDSSEDIQDLPQKRRKRLAIFSDTDD
ncbi:ATP-dependent DNA helicase mph1 [Penicillium diatomitis]|uniref:ATP-dependent DNA helicase n=1 Tax=Penicillium diatomitis TaxID=2819901 RepID=A0A9W9X4Z1_9EURO|nr:ATP-dependent DNA helicase mph1 [Penicillium diatomitis]KAJ5483978.1 ATP-dependent DNA helicase mph1 [Penicillium diatomitis]